MPVTTHPLSRLAGDLFDAARERLGVAAASAWFFSGHDGLNGRSPIQAIKHGDADAVKRIVLELGGNSR